MRLLNDETSLAVWVYFISDISHIFIVFVTITYINMGHWICIVVVLQCQWGWDSIGSPMAIEGVVSRTGLAGWQHVSKYF